MPAAGSDVQQDAPEVRVTEWRLPPGSAAAASEIVFLEIELKP